MRMRLNRNFRHFIAATLFMMAAATATPAYSAPGKWEQIRAERSDTRTVASDADTQIHAAKGVVVVVASKPVQVKIYTILGQLVNRETLPQGISQITIQPHGVYIIKTGDLTCKVAL